MNGKKPVVYRNFEGSITGKSAFDLVNFLWEEACMDDDTTGMAYYSGMLSCLNAATPYGTSCNKHEEDIKAYGIETITIPPPKSGDDRSSRKPRENWNPYRHEAPRGD